MKIYHYHHETGEYLGASDARRSPLDEAVVYLIPANATDKAPPPKMENVVNIYQNGEWLQKPDFRGSEWYDERTAVTITEIGAVPEGYTKTPKPFTAAEVKTREKQRLAAERYALETAGVSYGGMTIMTDRESVQILDSLVEKIRRGVIPSINWKCANGWIVLNAANVDEVEALVLTHIQGAFAWEKMQSDVLDLP